ncbi:MAG: GatB/YqeY domain-containing protein, partial [Candidatus Omnitrophica bacterium]|nr:GatB/YqeY domain-containing protein [Candidatus Omnitrophota bacterium]
VEDKDIIIVIKKQIKQRQDSIEQFRQGGRQDLVGKEEAELNILKSYLPAEMSQEDVRKIVKETIASLGASSIKDMGKVMKEASLKLAGRADNKLVSELVKAELS